MAGTPKTPEAFSRVVIDALLKDAGWNLTDGISVRFEYRLPDGTLADYVLCDRYGRSMAVIEAKRAAKNAHEAAGQGRAYAEQLQDLLWVTPGDLGRGEVKWIEDSSRKITTAGLLAKRAQLFPVGTVLVSTTATIGNVGIAGQPLYCNQQITAVMGYFQNISLIGLFR